ncbi:cytochrome P450 [Limnohabitans sp. Hippo3]|uniref:cytochrome P450 n=1 Tax=Limnohabitans sp. Hippo3 TaxID=1597956 RepID=UPI000D35B484|nr:cytochrome P450 [Limnohabitans sp. Hippo3]PUE43767.1 cytochrome [Limnohabitans sp. Hippo3]
MSTLISHITPPLSANRAQEIAQTLDLRALPRDFLDNPYPVYAALREAEPFKRMPDGSYFLTRHADLVAVYRDAKVFSSDKQVEFGPKYNHAPFNQPPYTTPGGVAPLFEHHTNSLVFNDPPLHTRVRRLIMGALTRRAIEAMEPGLVQLVDSLLGKIEAQGGGDLIEDFASAIPVEIIGNLLDVPHADREPLRGWSLAILGALEPALTPEQEALGNRSVTDFLAYLRELVAKRRQQPGDPEHDVLTRLIQGEANGDALSEVELLQNCVFLLNAGHETTTNLIGNALITLQEWPEQREQLKADLKLAASDEEREQILGRAVDEFLRFESSNQLGNRRALQATQINGVDLPAGALVTLCIGAANRDPAVYENPEQLNLRRTGNKHLAFGFGVHQCAGLSLARLEGRIAIGRFLQRFPNYRLTQTPVRAGRARFRGFLSAPFQTR